MAKSRIASRLARKWKADPQAHVKAVIRTVGDTDAAVQMLEQRGLTITHRYSLLPAVAVSGSAKDCLSLANEEWVTSVEEDRQVHTM